MALYDFSSYSGLEPGQITSFARKRFRDLVENPLRVGERILPWASVEDYEISTGKVNFRGIANAVIGMDSELPRGPLGTWSERQYSILKTGMKYEMIESELLKMKQLLDRRRLQPRDFASLPPFRLANALVNAYLDRAEQMRWAALANGTIQLRPGISVDYPIPVAHQVTLAGTDLWTDYANADGLADILAWDDQVYDTTGRHLEVIFMSRTAFNHLISQTATLDKLRAAFGTTGQQVAGSTTGIRPTRSSVNAWLAQNEIGPVVLYDRKYQEFDFTGATQPQVTRFLPENKVVGVAPTPIEGGVDVDVPGATATGYAADGPVAENGFNPGLYVWFTEKDEPLEVAVKSAGWTLPVITDGETLFQGTVF